MHDRGDAIRILFGLQDRHLQGVPHGYASTAGWHIFRFRENRRHARADDSILMKTRILLVEDHPEFRAMISRMLECWSFSVTAVSSVEEARAYLALGEPVAAVLSDYHLPDGNGLELLEWMKWENGTLLPFLLMSGGAYFADSPNNEFQFLHKPFRPDDLHQRLDRISAEHDMVEAA
jgi:DNA-binding NtrC family response regulator